MNCLLRNTLSTLQVMEIAIIISTHQDYCGMQEEQKKKKIKAFWELSSFTNIGSYESQFSSMHLKSNEPGSVNRHVSESRKSHN